MSGSAIRAAFEHFHSETRETLLVPGVKAEASLYGEVRKFLISAIVTLRPAEKWGVVEQANADTLGIPDYRISKGPELHGWIELKAVRGKDLDTLSGHDQLQFERFSAGLVNFILTNGWQWRLYRNGKLVGKPVLLGPSNFFDPKSLPYSVPDSALDMLAELLTQFTDAPLTPYTDPAVAVEALASRARALKLALVDVGAGAAGKWLEGLRSDFQALLFKNGQAFTWERFVDSYVQIAVFGTLLWRLEASTPVRLDQVVQIDDQLHPLLYQCMDVLWKPADRPDAVEPILEELCTTVNLVDPAMFEAHPGGIPYVPDPLVHAYEPFFRKYDPAARDQHGVFYTPAQVVQQIVDGIHLLLQGALGYPDGVLADEARFLDPATGTGTFVLGLLNKVAFEAKSRGWLYEEVVRKVIEERCWAFELFPGPYAIAHQRLDAALRAHGAVPTKRLPIFLADTLAAPESTMLPSKLGIAGEEIKRERERADLVKTADEILVIFGNPPYERVLGGKGASLELFAQRLFEIVKEATPAESKTNLKSTWDLFVAFWAWGLWALQPSTERQAVTTAPNIKPASCHGMVAYITNRTWIIGPSLSGLRKLVRSGAKEVWVLDLGGDARGAHGARSFAGGDDNVFPIQVGVAIVWLVFDKDFTGKPTVRYRRMYGKRKQKLAELAAGFRKTAFSVVPGVGADPLMPVDWGNGKIAAAPRIHDLFADPPMIGIQTARDKSPIASPIGTRADEVYAIDVALKPPKAIGRLAEWAALTSEAKRHAAWSTAQKRRSGARVPTPASLSPSEVRPLTYRPLDFRFVYDDPAWVDWWREDLHAALEATPTAALVTIPNDHGAGPAAIFVDRLMDQHCFRGSDGGNGVWLLWRPNPSGSSPDPRGVQGTQRSGLSPLTLDWLESLGRKGHFQEAFDYILAVLNGPRYTQRFWRALEVDTLRVPLTDKVASFDAMAALGQRCREAWTAGRTSKPGIAWAGVGSGLIGSATWDSDAIVFSSGRRVEGVTSDMWQFQVSGYPVLPRWLAARKHWAVSMKQSMDTLATIIAVSDLVELGPLLDVELEHLLA